MIRRQARERRVEGNGANEFAQFFSTLEGPQKIYWRTKSANEEGKKHGKLGCTIKCCRRFVQCRSVFGHAKRNCASEAYEPPLRFGMIASSKAATSSNST